MAAATDPIGRDTRSITRRLVAARRVLRKIDVIPQRDRAITEGNMAEISRLLTELEGKL